MSRRIRIGHGALERETKDITRQLKAVVINFRSGVASKKRAREKAKQIISRQFDTLLRMSRDRIQYQLKRVVELPPEELARLERWRDEYIEDFYKILDDVERGRGR